MGDRVFINTPTHLKTMALAIKDAGVTPELEVFRPVTCCLPRNSRQRTGEGARPFQICLRHPMGQPATPEAMTYMRSSAGGLHVVCLRHSLWQFPMVAQAVLLGCHPRSAWGQHLSRKGKLAPSTRRSSRGRQDHSRFWGIRSQRQRTRDECSGSAAQ